MCFKDGYIQVEPGSFGFKVIQSSSVGTISPRIGLEPPSTGSNWFHGNVKSAD